MNPVGTHYSIISSTDPNLQLCIDSVCKRLEGDYLQLSNWKEVNYSLLYCNNNIMLAIDQIY